MASGRLMKTFSAVFLNIGVSTDLALYAGKMEQP